jgi:nucleoside-diphosphate-sugar epimerase
MIRYNLRFSNKKVRVELGWEACSFEQGIAETWADYQALGWSK